VERSWLPHNLRIIIFFLDSFTSFRHQTTWLSTHPRLIQRTLLNTSKPPHTEWNYFKRNICIYFLIESISSNVCMLSLCLSMGEGVWGSGCIDPYFLHLGSSWRWVVSFTPQPLYPRGKSTRYPLDRRLGGPQNRSGYVKKRKFLTLPGLERRSLGRPARSQSLYRLH
jgi:hypothetical protein